MSVEMTGMSGKIRRPEDFAEARAVVVKRMVKPGGALSDVELFLQYTIIIQALEIAELIAKKQHGVA